MLICIFMNQRMSLSLLEQEFLKEAAKNKKKKKPKCKGTESSPVGSPRQRAFCGRMCGHRKKNTKSKGKKDPDSCINQALRRWKCRCAADEREVLKVVADLLIAGDEAEEAQSGLSDEACDALCFYVAMLRAVYMVHKQNHWMIYGHSGHTLLQRLYEEVEDDLDEAAEKAVGAGAALKYLGTESQIAGQFVPENKDMASVLEASTRIEKEFQTVAQKVYDSLKELDELTMGMDDMIMSHFSKSESRVYLLEHGDDKGK
jgi:DNA-binding ferritin-like protein